MAIELRVVFDANVIISAALLPRSVPRAAFDQAHNLGHILISEATLREVHDVLARAKFDRYLSKHERAEFLAALVRDAHS